MALTGTLEIYCGVILNKALHTETLITFLAPGSHLFGDTGAFRGIRTYITPALGRVMLTNFWHFRQVMPLCPFPWSNSVLCGSHHSTPTNYTGSSPKPLQEFLYYSEGEDS